MTTQQSKRQGAIGAVRAAAPTLGLLALMTLILLAPALVNGFPFVDIDSMSYLKTAILLEIPENRPIYYSIFAALLHWAIHPWPVAIGQCAFLAVGIWHVADKLFGVRNPRVLLAVTALLSAVTVLPWYAAYIMPDVFTAVMIVALLMLGLCWERMNWIERGAYVVVVAASIAFHYGNVPIALGANLVFAALALFGWRPTKWREIVAMNAAIALGVLALFAATTYDHGRIAMSPSSSSFYFARLLDDGAAIDILEAECPTRQWNICTELEGIQAAAAARAADPNVESVADYFLWRGPLQRLGDFQAVEPEAAEINKRTWAVYPGRQAAASVRNAFAQLPMYTIGPSFFGAWGEGIEPTLTIRQIFGDAVATQYLASRQAHGQIPFALINGINLAALLVSLAFLAWAALRAYRQERILFYAIVGLVCFFAGNAFVMGAFSGVFERYQARLLWLAPLFALLLAARWFWPVSAVREGPQPLRNKADPGDGHGNQQK